MLRSARGGVCALVSQIRAVSSSWAPEAPFLRGVWLHAPSFTQSQDAPAASPSGAAAGQRAPGQRLGLRQLSSTPPCSSPATSGPGRDDSARAGRGSLRRDGADAGPGRADAAPPSIARGGRGGGGSRGRGGGGGRAQAPPQSSEPADEVAGASDGQVDPADAIFANVGSSADLKEADVGRFYALNETVISEAFDAWYQNRSVAPNKPVMAEGKEVPAEPRFAAGCRGLQEEFAQSWYPYIMHRQQHHALWYIVRAPARVAETPFAELAARSLDLQGGPSPGADAAVAPAARCFTRFLVAGPPGAGKSVCLAATAEHLRQLGWIVMYIPDAMDITLKNKFFSKNEDTGMFDTRDAAQNILNAMRDAHGPQLEAMPQQLEGGTGSLLDLCNTADRGSDASVCNAVVRLKLELYRLPAHTRSAVIIDNYNALFWTTPFGEVRGLDTAPEDQVEGHRQLYNRPVDAQELTLGANLRVLGDLNNGHTACIVAGSASGQVPALPFNVDKDDYVRISIPLMSKPELSSMLHYYRHVHAMAPGQEITPKGVAAAHLLTQGNGYDIRRYLHYLLPYDPALEDLDVIGTQQAASEQRM